MSEKYPNADTSAERLAELQEMYPRDIPTDDHEGANCYRDLLAMIEKQRWRKRSEEEPALAQIITVMLHERPNDGDHYITLCFGCSDIDEPWEWWYGLPPIPKE